MLTQQWKNIDIRNVCFSPTSWAGKAGFDGTLNIIIQNSLGENKAFAAQIYLLGARVRSFEGCLGFEHPIAAWLKFSPPGGQDPRYEIC